MVAVVANVRALVRCPRIRRYMAAHIDNRPTITVREFISEFDGMTGTAKQKAVLAETGASHVPLHNFFGLHKANTKNIQKLLDRLRSTPNRCGPPLSASSGESISTPAWKRRAVIPKHLPTLDALVKLLAFRV